MGLMDILQSALNANSTGNNAEQHFDQVAQHASTDELGAGLAGAMRSDQTPPFSDMVGQLFGNSSSTQQAGVLNQILAALGPLAASALAGGALGKVLAPGQTQLTPDQASQLSPAQVSEIAAHAEEAEPGVVDQVSQFYAQHSGLIKTLGGAALMIALAKMKDNANRG
ncbi:MAG: hypothetical protein EOO26_14475 [Comamonadaceae bacterium]|nr:MAG: hypothetical protein EOO26_14475 [Comamonadaceae bacterium]